MTTALTLHQGDYGLSTIVSLYDVVAQADVPFLPINIRPAVQPALLVISVVFSAPGVLSIVVTKDDVERTMQLNSGVALQAGCLYSFSHVIDGGELVNYMYSTDCTADLFKVQAAAQLPEVVSISDVHDIMTTAVIAMMLIAFGAMAMRSLRA